MIKSTVLGIEGRGILTCSINLSFGCSRQSFGGYSFDVFDNAVDKRIGMAWGMEFIRRLLETVGVDSWEKLPGTYCRIQADFHKVHRIGHIVDDKWFDPDYHLSFLTK